MLNMDSEEVQSHSSVTHHDTLERCRSTAELPWPMSRSFAPRPEGILHLQSFYDLHPAGGHTLHTVLARPSHHRWSDARPAEN